MTFSLKAIVILLILGLFASPANAKVSKKFLSGMNDFATTIHLTDAQNACVGTAIYDGLGKKRAKNFVKFTKEMIIAKNVPDDIDDKGKLYLIDRMFSANLGLIVLSQGAMNSLGEATRFRSTRKSIAANCKNDFDADIEKALELDNDSESEVK